MEISKDFLESALDQNNALHTMDQFKSWFESRKKANPIKVTPTTFDKLSQWKVCNETGNISHQSGKFFTIMGLETEIEIDSKKSVWKQPIILQPEHGILGLVVKKINGVFHFLMQAKMEPGNINNFQLSPTVQATKSNYTRVHQGKTPTYLELFMGAENAKVLVRRLLSEHGTRFYEKRNLNIIVELENDDDFNLHDDFIWLTLNQIKELLQYPNIVNSEARSVLSTIPYSGSVDKSQSSSEKNLISIKELSDENSFDELNETLNWISELKAKIEVHSKLTTLNAIKDWEFSSEKIKHRNEKSFSVVAVEVSAGQNREVTTWNQPLLSNSEKGISGFLMTYINETPYFLVHAKVEPGIIDLFEVGPSISAEEFGEGLEDFNHSSDLIHFFQEAPENKKVLDVNHSLEGGRFYLEQRQFMIVEIENIDSLPNLNERYRVISFQQLLQLNQLGFLSMEAREILSCLKFI